MLIFGPGALRSAFANSPPYAPVITEPEDDGAIVDPADVHMETMPMSDPDSSDTHYCTDWEIWTINPSERIWFALCKMGEMRVHIHLGDGFFSGSYAGRNQLFHNVDYKLRVRHRDNTGLWSPYSERFFRTSPPTVIDPMMIKDVSAEPGPTLTDENNEPLYLPGSGSPGYVRMETPERSLLLKFQGVDGLRNAVTNPPSLAQQRPLRLLVSGGSSSLPLPRSLLRFNCDEGTDRTIYFPGLDLAPGAIACFWVSENGSTYWGDTLQTAPDFSSPAQGSPVPWKILQPGYQVEIASSDFQLPVNIAFAPNAGAQPDDPYYYVTELYGTIKVVYRDGSVHDYATGLLNFNPTGNFPGSGEQGLAGICVDPPTGDIFATMLYDAAPPDGPHYPKVVRFHSADGGRTAESQTTVLDMPGEAQGQSHFISNITIGPDGALYVHMGDGFETATALDLNSFRGKILRLNPDGSAPPDNPFYSEADGITATDYIFAYGFRNPFGGSWRSADGRHYEVENGPEVNDRFAKVLAGTSYGWNGTHESMTMNAIYNWTPTHAPVNIAFVEPQTFGGSRFPAEKMDHAFITESGPTWAAGPQDRGKRIVEFVLSPDGNVVTGPNKLIDYNGSGKATAVGLAAGPDGLYFSDLYKDFGYDTPIDRGAHILRVKFVGSANFTAAWTRGNVPFDVQFTDLSDVPNPLGWLWSFGDGGASTERNPLHQYIQDGVYDVRLEVTGDNGIAVEQKNGYIVVGEVPAGLQADYYNNLDFTAPVLSRVDPIVDFNWGSDAPDGSMGPDEFSIRWNGRVLSDYSETYTFFTYTDDGVRLWVDGQLLIDYWVNQPPTEHSGTISLTAGQKYDIRMEYYEKTQLALARLEWRSPSLPRQVIPQSHLFLSFPADVAEDAAGASSASPRFDAGWPNPLTQPAPIRFSLPASGRAVLSLYDVAGRRIENLFDGNAEAGRSYTVELDPAGRAAGIYFIALETPRQGHAVRKLIVLK